MLHNAAALTAVTRPAHLQCGRTCVGGVHGHLRQSKRRAVQARVSADLKSSWLQFGCCTLIAGYKCSCQHALLLCWLWLFLAWFLAASPTAQHKGRAG